MTDTYTYDLELDGLPRVKVEVGGDDHAIKLYCINHLGEECWAVFDNERPELPDRYIYDEYLRAKENSRKVEFAIKQIALAWFRSFGRGL